MSTGVLMNNCLVLESTDKLLIKIVNIWLMADYKEQRKKRRTYGDMRIEKGQFLIIILLL